jgi:hypothetical protein
MTPDQLTDLRRRLDEALTFNGFICTSCCPIDGGIAWGVTDNKGFTELFESAPIPVTDADIEFFVFVATDLAIRLSEKFYTAAARKHLH